ncbi:MULTISPECIES: glycosyltransferase family 2 protein [unclassified Methylobacterium]|uniref:glycosyltransferase family 2 protein n=1 Tax=unclassified Methylobacterium TaxID=2615210 RepID=UPI001FEDC429|nr:MULTISPECIES: glycosyltransferase family 2 protein [unclassified Methylobacterium]
MRFRYRLGPQAGRGLSWMCVMLAIGLTLFHPSRDQVDDIVRRYAGSRHPVLAFDNGGLGPVDRMKLEAAGVRLLSAGSNVGIAAALNGVVEAATRVGADGVLLLDQDAQVGPEMIGALADARTRLRAENRPCAVIGPVPGRANAEAKPPRFRRRPRQAAVGTLVPVEFLATSGSLVDVAAFRAVGPFRADYFIDGVELEWCFRAWDVGYGCWMAQDAAIGHRVGGGTIRALGIETPRQPLFRMATYLRNSVYGWRLRHIPLPWKLRQVAYLPVQTLLYWRDSGYRPAVLRRLAGAVLDGFRGRLGRPFDAP